MTEELAALARAVERQGRRVGELDRLVRQLAGDLAEVAAAVLVPDDDAPAAVRSWLLADDPERAVTDLVELIGWTRRVFLRYPDAALSACWLWHPDVIEELWWLRQAHADAFHPKTGSWQRVGDWHERQRPGVVRRVRHAIGTCELSVHRGGPHARPAALPPLAEHAETLATSWATDPIAPRPEPTDEQLDQAEHYTRQHHRRD
ncbi:MAG: hypothetical protein J0I49_18585 [Pseudonocardia sp.]|uniref:hypothetical protein n=1 Tax=Pseudonocardia sp. TaxID=60912 RepID=UPI001ACF4E65|nr:hypothetical protein [Pseudonocardia sp.]MBN9100097.1 hypothetical protein [Pseudonocardia sp.]